MDLAANQYVCPDGYGVERFLEEAADAGFQRVALSRAALDEMTIPSLRRELQTRGLSVTTLNGAGYFTWADPDRRRAQEGENLALVAAAVELGFEALCVITGGCAEQPDIATARALIADGLAGLDAVAASEGLRLGLEPIHPKDVATKGCVNTIAQARELIAPLSSTGLIVDLFHSCWDSDLINVAADASVSTLQICNVTEEPRRSPSLDKGILNVRRLLEQFRQAGFSGPVEFEIFAADHNQPDIGSILRAAAEWAQG